MSQSKNYAALIIGIVVVSSSGFIYWLLRKQKYTAQEGELQGEEILTIMETWDSKSDEVIKKLHPKLRDRASNFVNDLKKANIRYRIYNGTRTFNEQAALYGKGRTEKELIDAGIDKKYSQQFEKKVTNAKPGESFHNYGLAFDGVEILNGNAVWKSLNEKIIVETGKKYGLFWGGNFTSIKDTPHFEDQQYGNISQLLALYNSGKLDTSGYLIV